MSGRPTARRAFAPILAILAAPVFGCSDGSERPRAMVVDSAGTRVVTYDLTGVEVPAYRSVGEHDLEIGVQNGSREYTFGSVVDMAVTASGDIVVSDGVAEALRVYDAAGGYVRTIGGPGEGPGEFTAAPLIAGLAGDTIFAFDGRGLRITSFSLAGALIGSVSLQWDGVGRPQAAIRLNDGTYLSPSTWVDPDAADEVHDVRLELDSIVIERLDTSGAPLDTLRVMADRNRVRRVQSAGADGFRTQQSVTPFAPRASVTSDGVRLIVGRSDAFELEWVRPSTDVETVLRVLGAEHPATAGDIRSHQEAALREELGDGEIDPMIRRLNLDFLPERLPAFGAVVVSDVGDVWVSRTAWDASEGFDWLVFTDAGELMGNVHTPPEFQLRVVRDGSLFGFVLDGVDVPYVRRHRLMEPVGSAR